MIPSWDLFIIMLTAVIVAYSIIIGKHDTMKIVVGTYIALLAADGLGNILGNYIYPRSDLFPIFAGLSPDMLTMVSKIGLFVIGIVYLTLRGKYDVEVNDSESQIVSVSITTTLGVLSALLIISGLLVYTSGASFVFQAVNMSDAFMMNIYSQSYLVKILMDYSSVIFVLPALYFIVDNMLGGHE